MTMRSRALFSSDPQSGSLLPGKFSEMFLEFAAPLLADGEPPTVHALRSALRIAMVCWNAAYLRSMGDKTFDEMLATVVAGAPAQGRAILERLLHDRVTRYGGIPVLLDVDVEGDDVRTARVVARAYEGPKKRATTEQHATLDARDAAARGTGQSGTMRPFDSLYYEVAAREAEAWRVTNQLGLPSGNYVLRELYCAEAKCDCRRVLLQITHAETRTIVATINYAFEPAEPPFEDELQIQLDLLNTQSDSAPHLLAMFTERIAQAPDYHARLVRHYEMWKRVVDDERHPLHGKVRNASHEDSTFKPAFPVREQSKRHGVRVGANDRCPCGSGRKYKKCCRQ